MVPISAYCPIDPIASGSPSGPVHDNHDGIGALVRQHLHVAQHFFILIVIQTVFARQTLVKNRSVAIRVHFLGDRDIFSIPTNLKFVKLLLRDGIAIDSMYHLIINLRMSRQ